jgi:DNA-binding transcriptional MerR regulator
MENPIQRQYFESRQVTELVGVPARSLKYWAASGILVPEKDAVGRPGIRRGYTFKNLVEIAVLYELYKLKVSTSLAREAIRRLREKNFDQKLLCYLLIAGGEIEIFTEEDLKEEFMVPMLYWLGDGKLGEWSDLTEELKNSPQKIDSIASFLKTDAYSHLGERIFNKEGAILVIAVRSPQVKPPGRPLWNKLEEKVSQLNGNCV